MDTTVSFSHEKYGKGIGVTIETKRLRLCSTRVTEAAQYADLYGKDVNMGHFASGERVPRAETEARVQAIWAQRWAKGDPYSSLSIFKQEDKAFIGHVVLGADKEPGIAELTYVIDEAFQHKGYGTEAVTAVVRDFAPKLVQQGYLVRGAALEVIRATARLDNPDSHAILMKVGMAVVPAPGIDYGPARNHYELRLS